MMPVWVVFEALDLVEKWANSASVLLGFQRPEVKCPTVNLEDVRIVGSLPELGSWLEPQKSKQGYFRNLWYAANCNMIRIHVD